MIEHFYNFVLYSVSILFGAYICALTLPKHILYNCEEDDLLEKEMIESANKYMFEHMYLDEIIQFNVNLDTDYVLFCFGEVDIRAHLIKQMDLQNKTVNERTFFLPEAVACSHAQCSENLSRGANQCSPKPIGGREKLGVDYCISISTQ